MNSIKTKLLMVMIPIICIALVGVAWLNQNKAKEFLIEGFEENSFVKLDRTQVKLDDALLIHIERLQGLAQSSDVINESLEQQQEFITRVSKQFTDYSMIFVADQTGQSITSSNVEANVADRAYFQKIMAGDSFAISEPVTLEANSVSITEDMGSISAVTEQSSAGAQEVSAASEEQASSAVQISHGALELSNLSKELQEMLKQFKIS